VSIEPTGVLVPPICACCGSEAARSDVARLGTTAKEIIVGYCDECRKHQGTERARRLGGGLASALLGLSLALLLPLVSPPLSAVAFVTLVFAGASLPVIVVVFWPRRRRPGHAASGPAVRFVASGEVLCADDRFAAELARENGTTRRLSPWHESRWSFAMLLGPLIAPPLGLAVQITASPLVRVINLTGDEFVVEVDGVRRASLAPTSVESPSAGVELRIAAGEHELVARALDGSVLERARASVQSGRAHLFAPASAGHCFFLETAAYGRSSEGPPERETLDGPPHFWSLPDDLGGWFSAPPAAAVAETRWTGGTVTVLRHAPCELVR
jgi:hypothetical protein